jgi:hypothetical protein
MIEVGQIARTGWPSVRAASPSHLISYSVGNQKAEVAL